MHLVPLPDGTYLLLVAPGGRELLVQLCAGLRAELLEGTDDPGLRRLFPPAYPDDADRQQFFDQMTRGELADSRIAALTVMGDTVGNEVLTGDEIESWMVATNALRLVLGTRLDVREDDDPAGPDDPDALAFALYDDLSGLLVSIVRCLAAR